MESFMGCFGGGGWIRTNVGVSQQIYSLPPLATRAPLRSEPQSLAREHSLPWKLERRIGGALRRRCEQHPRLMACRQHLRKVYALGAVKRSSGLASRRK